MFAIAIWDAAAAAMVLGRDRLGKKPLVYRHEPGRLSFASELKSLLEIPGTPRDIDPSAPRRVPDVPVRAASQTRSSAASASCRPATTPSTGTDQLQVRPYWEPDFNAEMRMTRSGGHRAAARDARIVRGDAAAERRAAGGVSVRRRRFLADRGDRPAEYRTGR